MDGGQNMSEPGGRVYFAKGAFGPFGAWAKRTIKDQAKAGMHKTAMRIKGVGWWKVRILRSVMVNPLAA